MLYVYMYILEDYYFSKHAIILEVRESEVDRHAPLMY